MKELPKAFEEAKKKCVWVNYSKSKIPINPKTLHNASSTNNKTWTDYKRAAANVGKSAFVKIGKNEQAEEKILGVGLIIGDASGIRGIDLDHVIDDNGIIDHDAESVIQMMQSYTEISMSGTGIHILYTGKSPVKGTKVKVNEKSREMYGERRYIAITGDVYGQFDELRDCTSDSVKVYDKFIRPYAKKPVQTARKRQKAVYNNSNSNPAVEAIRKHNHVYFLEKLKEEKREFMNREELFNFIYKYPLDRFLGVEGLTSFCCFFHPDTNPSASVYKGSSDVGGMWLYHCHAEGITLSIKTLVEKIGNFESEVDSLEYIQKCLNCRLKDTKWSRRQHKTIDLIMDKMNRTDSESFSALCPCADSNISFGKSLYLSILIFAKSTIFPSKYDKNGDVLFYMSVNHLLDITKRGSRDKATKWIKCFCYHRLLEAVPDEELPPEILAKAKRQSQNGNKHISFYKVPSTVYNKLKIVEAQAKRWKENKYTIKNTSYEMFMRAEGSEIANRLYPQHYKTATVGNIATLGAEGNRRAEKRHDKVHGACIRLLETQGYFTKADVIRECGSEYWTGKQWNRSIKDIIDMYGLSTCRLNKQLKERFNISSTGFPTVYFFDAPII